MGASSPFGDSVGDGEEVGPIGALVGEDVIKISRVVEQLQSSPSTNGRTIAAMAHAATKSNPRTIHLCRPWAIFFSSAGPIGASGSSLIMVESVCV